MKEGEPRQYTPEEKSEMSRSRILREAKMIKGGARVTPEGDIIPSDNQLERIKEEKLAEVVDRILYGEKAQAFLDKQFRTIEETLDFLEDFWDKRFFSQAALEDEDRAKYLDILQKLVQTWSESDKEISLDAYPDEEYNDQSPRYFPEIISPLKSILERDLSYADEGQLKGLRHEVRRFEREIWRAIRENIKIYMEQWKEKQKPE